MLSRELPPPLDVARFGPYEIRVATQEFFKHSTRLKFPPQAFAVLRILLERQGQLVTRQEFHRVLWPADTFVDFDQGLNNAIKKIREALNDSAESPRYVETLPRRGYRFIGQAEWSYRDLPAPVFSWSTPSEAVRGDGKEESQSMASEGEAIPRLVADGVAVAPSASAPKESGRPWAKIAAYISAGLAAVVLAGLAYPRFHAPADSGKLTVVPFTTFPGLELSPTFSPDGSQIAFAWNGDPAPGTKGFDLYAKVVGSESLLRLTNQASETIDPAWSPDGSQIGFDRSSGPDPGVYVVPALGGAVRKLSSTRGLAVPAPISWSPDGKWIAFADAPLADGLRRIYLLSVENLTRTQLPHAERCSDEMYPAFSPDGAQLAYVCYLRDGGFGVYSVATPAGDPRPIKVLAGWAWGLAWTGDGKRLILSQYEGGAPNEELLEITLADDAVRKLPFGQGAIWPAVSPKGDKLAFALEHARCSIWRRDLMHPQASPLKLISSTHGQFDPQYSPDGKHIAFASDRGGPPEIWMSDGEGSHLTQISNLKNLVTGSPRWSPDGQKLVFDSGEFGHASLYVADIAERLPRKLAINIESASVPSWSREGRSIYFVGNGNELGGKIYRVPASGGDAEAVSEQPGYGPVESYDGKAVYFVRNTGGNWVLESARVGRPGTESPIEGAPPIFFATHWELTPGGVYFVPSEAHTTMRYFDFATRQSKEVFTQENGFALGLSVSGDGRWILYPQAEPTSDIMLVGNFH